MIHRGTGAIGLVVALVAATSLLVAPMASGAATFGAPFQLNNPTHPFVFGVQDVEPSVRVDTLGNVFPGAIRGVPAGVDVCACSRPTTAPTTSTSVSRMR